MQKSDLSSQTLRNYVKAAHRVLLVWLGRPIPLYDKNSMGKNPRLHEYIGQQIRDRRNWERKRGQKLPLTREIFQALASMLAKFGTSLDIFLGDLYAVYDWIRLGAFAGFRVSEYAQGKVAKGKMYLRLPDSDDIPFDQRGKPVAFVAADFTFYTADLTLIPHDRLMSYRRRGLVRYLQLRWRFDKSANNFVLRRYEFTDDPIFNPVDAAVNIVYRARLLHVPVHEPLGVWKNPTGRVPYRFLRAATITKVMRLAVVQAYPDPKHYYRINIHLVVTHCVRVTAAVLMKLGGAGNDEIAHAERWHPTSVPTYLRDGFESAHVTQNKTLLGLNVNKRNRR